MLNVAYYTTIKPVLILSNLFSPIHLDDPIDQLHIKTRKHKKTPVLESL